MPAATLFQFPVLGSVKVYQSSPLEEYNPVAEPDGVNINLPLSATSIPVTRYVNIELVLSFDMVDTVINTSCSTEVPPILAPSIVIVLPTA